MINPVLEIKLLGPEDWRVLQATRLRALRDSPDAFASDHAVEVLWSTARWQQLLAAATWVVAKESGSVIGIAGLFDGRPFEGWHIESIWVAPTHRQLGVFRALLKTLADQQRGNGGRRLALWVLEKNCAARRAYARLGFVPTGERQRLPDGRYELRLRISLPSRR